MNTWMCSFSFPVVFGLFFSVTGIPKDKDPTGQKSFVSFGTFRRDTQFWFRVSILFLTVFQERTLLVPARNDGRARAMAQGVQLIGGRLGALLFALRSLFR
jgi:hypothetical protein